MAATLSRSQVDLFLKYIGVPEELHHAPPSVSLLKTLHVYMISACPYDNLSIHYNPLHSIVIDPQFVFKKVVLDARGRGGYCMELAILFNRLLRGMGFDAYTVGARTRDRRDGVPHGDYPGWVHIVNIVTFHATDTSDTEERYHVDVSFGGDGPISPLPLIAGVSHRNIGQQEVRLVRDWIPAQLHRVEQSKVWIYQYRNGPDMDWNSFYSFPDVEFMLPDWEVVNMWASTSSKSRHTSSVLMVKFLRREIDAESHDQEIYGKRMLVDNVVKENLGGKTKVIKVLDTEAQRIESLREDFGVHLIPEEINAIRGRVGDLDKHTDTEPNGDVGKLQPQP